MLTFCTGNRHKFEEVRRELGIPLKQYDGGYPEIQANTLEEVVKAGMDHLDPVLEGPYFLDDSGLSVEGLGGFPGVYSAYVFGTIGNHGILKLLDGEDDRSAVFRCVLGYRDVKGERHVFVGEAKGRIAGSAEGNNGFGYDPIFVPEGHTLTFAQMSGEEKDRHSHRGMAVRKFKSYLGTGPGRPEEDA